MGVIAFIFGGFRQQPAEAKTAPPLLLAHAWDNERDLAGWWMSEKLDGVRAYWDGKGKFLSHQGNRFFAPDWFTKGLPRIPLDGELWMDRKRFQQTVSIVRRQDGGEQWRGVKYVVFDAPAPDESFESRYAIIKWPLELGMVALVGVWTVERLSCRARRPATQ